MNRAALPIGPWLLCASFCAALTLSTVRATAQSPSANPSPSPAATTPVASPAAVGTPPAPLQTPMTLPGAAADPIADATDHAAMVGHFGIGYMGRRTMAIDIMAAGGAATTVDAPVIGARYWLSPRLGIDAGIGLLLNSGSISTGATSADLQGYTVFVLHGGVPLALAGSRHFTFEVIPELNLGFASSQRDGTGAKLSGIHFDLGARAGAEIQFGFIGIPELSLQAGVGLALAYDRVKVSPAMGDATSSSRTVLGTGVGNNPWDIFTGNIAALYYFD